MICINCGKRKAQKDDLLGYLPCRVCQRKQSGEKVKESICLEGEEIKQQRKEYRDDAIQPFRGGVLSKEYVDKYGTKGINVEPGEVKQAKYVWGSDKTGYVDYYTPEK